MGVMDSGALLSTMSTKAPEPWAIFRAKAPEACHGSFTLAVAKHRAGVHMRPQVHKKLPPWGPGLSM